MHSQDAQLDVFVEDSAKLHYAPFHKRVLGWFIDAVPFLLLALLISAGMSSVLDTRYASAAVMTGFSAAICIQLLLYVPLMESRGGTLGKKLMRIRTRMAMVDIRPTLMVAFKRSLFVAWPLIVGLLYNIPLVLEANKYVTHAESESFLNDLHASHKMESDNVFQSYRRMREEQHEQDEARRLKQAEEDHSFKDNSPQNMVLTWAFIAVGVVGSALAINSKKRQTWADSITNVIVVS